MSCEKVEGSGHVQPPDKAAHQSQYTVACTQAAMSHSLKHVSVGDESQSQWYKVLVQNHT